LACPEATQAIIRYASKRRNARPTSAHTVTGGVRRSKVGNAPEPPVPDAGIVLVATETTPFLRAAIVTVCYFVTDRNIAKVRVKMFQNAV
jgi:hypothetical protein